MIRNLKRRIADRLAPWVERWRTRAGPLDSWRIEVRVESPNMGPVYSARSILLDDEIPDQRWGEPADAVVTHASLLVDSLRPVLIEQHDWAK